MDLFRSVIAHLLVLLAPPGICFWFLIHPFIGFWRRVGPTGTYLAMTGMGLAMMGAMWPLRAVLVGPDYGTHGVLMALGVPCLALAFFIQRKRGRFLPFSTLAGLPELAPERHGIALLDQGIYGVVRHPRYVEFTLAVVGWALVVNHRGTYLLIPFTLVTIAAIVHIEERELRERFGDAHRAYCERVPRFFPRLRS